MHHSPTTAPAAAPARRPRRLSRRALLVHSAVGSVVVAAELATPGVLRRAFAAPLGAPDDTLEIVLPGPQLRLSLDLHGLAVVGDELVALAGATTHRLVVRLPGAHTATSVLLPGEPAAGGAQPSVSAAPTRLVLDVSPPVPLTLVSLLDWASWALVTDQRAAEDQHTAVTGISGPAAEDVTRLELPAAVELCPLPDVRVRLDVDADEDGTAAPVRPWTIAFGRDLGLATIFAPEALVRLRAVHTPGYRAGADPSDTGDPFPRATDALTRERLVRATGDWSAAATAAYPDHEPLAAAGLRLGPDGASGAVAAAWSGSGDLASYAHLVTDGRSDAVAVAGRGALLPFGHAAAITDASLRTTTIDDEGVPTDALRRETRLVVGGGTVTTPTTLPGAGRGIPFRDVTAPALDVATTAIPIPGVDEGLAHLVADADGVRLQVPCTATDRGGNTVSFDTPMVFIAAEAAADPTPGGVLDTVLAWLREPPQRVLFTVGLHLQTVQLAEVDDPADAPLVTGGVANIVLRGAVLEDGLTPTERLAAGRIAFGPEIDTIAVTTPTLDALSGADQGSTTVRFDEAFLTHGLGTGNPTRTWARLATSRSTATERPGASLAAPDIEVEVLGLDLGASVDLAGATSWDPVAALPDTARLLGVALRSIVPPVELGDDVAGQPELPRVTATTTGEGDTLAAELALRWEPRLTSLVVAGTPTFVVSEEMEDLGLDAPFAVASSAAITVTETVALGPDAAAGSEVVLDLRRVAVQVPPGAPVATVWLERVTFEDVDGDRSVSTDVRQVAFTGALGFLDPLQDLLARAGVELLPPLQDGVVTVGVAVQVPAIGLGVVSVDAFTAELGMRIPFTDDPATVFVTLGTRAEPVGVSLLGIGGDAWFDLEVGGHPDGIVRLDAGLALGIELSVNAIIAKAWVSGSLALGVRLEQTEVEDPVTGEEQATDLVEIYAAVQLAIGIAALGLIEVNGQADFELAYTPALRLLSGSATFTFTTETLWSSERTKSKTFEASYSIGAPAGTAGGSVAALGAPDPGATDDGAPIPTPTFADRYPADKWLDYGAAFA